MNEKPSISLYKVRRDVKCLTCGHIGAIQFTCKYYPYGIGNKAKGIKSLEEYSDKPYIDDALGFGGTIPWECMNCGNTGLIDFSGLEGYKQAFKSIKMQKKT